MNLLGKLKSEKGFMTFLMGITLPLMIAFSGLLVDFGRCYAVKGQLQTACDAASLAGAEAATATPVTEDQVQTDSDGNITGINVVVTGWNIVFDPEVSLQAAQEAFLKNQQIGLLASDRGVIFSQQELGSDVGWHGEVTGTDNWYMFKARVKVKTVFIGPICDLIWGNPNYYNVAVYTESYSKPKIYTD